VQDGGTFSVPVLVNGTMRLNFLIDSGASDVVIPADVFKTLFRSGTIDETDILGKQRYSMADGREGETIAFRLRSVRVGSVTLSNVTASVTPAAGSPLLGQSFLSRLRSWSLDNRRSVLILN
jgi:clan AA aspartic protease (TIGR02281 family)